MEKGDMALLIEVEDELHNMDMALEQLAGHERDKTPEQRADILINGMSSS